MNKRTTERRGYGKLVALTLVAIAICYYGLMGIKCVKHCQALMNNRVATINFNISE